MAGDTAAPYDLAAIAARVHHEEASAALTWAEGYIGELTKECARLRAEGAEQLAALELALPVLEMHEPCGYYCDEDHGHVDHPATYAVYRAVNEHPLGAALLEELTALLAWQEKVCAIIQPAETPDEWGADVADIIAWREEGRRRLRAMLLVFVEQRWTIEDMIAARTLCGLPEPPPFAEALAELRAAVGHHFDGVDVEAFMREVRGDDAGGGR